MWTSVGQTSVIREGARPGPLTPEREPRDEPAPPAEDRFRAAFAQAPAGVELFDADGKLTDANEACLALFGLTSAAPVIGFDLFADPNLSDDARERVRRGESVAFDLVFDFDVVRELGLYPTTRTGKIDVECSISALRTSDGRLNGYVVVVTDISDRKRTQRALEESEERFRAVFDKAPVGIALVEPATGRFVTINETYCGIVGYSRQEMVTRRFAEITHPGDVGANVENLGRVRSGELAVYSTQKRYLRKDGSTVWVALTVVGLHGTSGDVDLLLTIVDDISERRKAEEDLSRYAHQLAEANRLKDLFTDILRHDTMNPANTIRMAAELLVRKESDADKLRLLETIRRSTGTLAEMAANAAKYARLVSAEGVDLELSELDLNATLRSVVTDFELALAGKEIEVELAPGSVAFAQLNPMVKDVFANLISNAIKYSPAKSTIRIDVQDSGEAWKISVSDSGEGISDEHKQRVFKRFERVGRVGIKGSGLGLAIARHIVTAHGGKIWVEDNPGGGSVFVVTLPKTRPSPSARRPLSPPRDPRAGA